MGLNEGRAVRDRAEGSLGSESVRAAIMLLLSFLAFVLVPNTLLGYLTTRMTPNGRDLVVTGVWAISFVIACVVFVRMQPGRNT